MPHSDPERQREWKRDWRNRNLVQERTRRRENYRIACPRGCGGTMSGGNGTARDPKMCFSCYLEERKPEHGTASRYQGGCRCDDCRAANATASREYYQKRRAQKPSE